MKTRLVLILSVMILGPACGSVQVNGSDHNPNTGWLKDAHYGVFVHWLPSDRQGLEQTESFDVDALAGQLKSVGAGYLVLTLGQNSGFMNSPNPTYERITGYGAGERCSTRDLPLDLHRALSAKGIKLMLYLPCQTPNRDARAQEAFGLPQGAKDQPIDTRFAEKWAEVVRDWSVRYGDKVAGWWFDGGYEWIGFNEEIATLYGAAVKSGNPNAIVTFNPGVKLIRWTHAEDYTAGELNEPFDVVPEDRWVNGSQWHALTYLGDTWGRRNTRFTQAQWIEWSRSVVAKGGVLTLDLGPNVDANSGPIGGLAELQLKQVRAIGNALRQEAGRVNPHRLRRADSYFGLHFDFHAGMDCTEIGKNTTREMIQNVIRQTRPDYIQIDCKGHPGLSSYPTKVGNPAPGFVGDPLKLWREVTAEHGVALYMHYSGVWDSEAIRRHPDWAVTNADGSKNQNATSFFNPYVDELLIPQLRELAGEYGVDGAWVDGECWASQPDYGEAAVEAFQEATGFAKVPRKPGDPHWFEFLEFNREAFRNYLRYYIDEVKKTHPDMQLCSNWAFSDHMPEEVSAPVDWISGDYTPEDSVNSARLSARYLVHQGKPWDLMAWSFARQVMRNGSRQKTAVQLQREAAAVLAQGGGFQCYYNQRRDGSIREEHLPVMAEVAKFCRERQAVTHRAMPVPQIALLYSTASHYREINSLFGRDLSRIQGTLQALLESQQVVDVVSEHSLRGRMSEYPLIVVAECDDLDSSFKKELVSYATNGGKLLLVGPQAASLFVSELDLSLAGMRNEPRFLACGGELLPTQGPSQSAALGSKARAVGRLYGANDSSSEPSPAASITPIGKGQIAATHFSFSRGYLANRSTESRVFLNGLVTQLFPAPLVEVTGSSDVDVSVNGLDGKLAINLVNTSGAHWDRDHPLFESVDPIGPLQVKIRAEVQPTKITLEPGGRSLPYDYRDGEVSMNVAQLDIHSIIMVESSEPPNPVAPKPLYRDPVYDGAADPVVIWNRAEKKWFMLYTNRRANQPGLRGVSWVHGTKIGIAESVDGGVTWTYRGNAQIPLGTDEDSHWAPDVVYQDGVYHMFLSFVPGMHEDWSGTRFIHHLTSADLIHWSDEGRLDLASDRVIDAGLLRMPNGTWRLWYNNEPDRKAIYLATSPGLYAWTDRGKVVGDKAGEGPKVFRWKGWYWMIVDQWEGLGVYRSDDADHWERQPDNILAKPGTGEDDQVKGGHADVVVSADRAFLFYFTHPGRRGSVARQDAHEQRRSSIQVVELEHRDGRLTCDRDQPTRIQLRPPKPSTAGPSGVSPE